MKDYVERMCIESMSINATIEDLETKSDKLYNFIQGEVYKTLSEDEQELCEMQYDYMLDIINMYRKYGDIVDQRIALNIVK